MKNVGVVLFGWYWLKYIILNWLEIKVVVVFKIQRNLNIFFDK